MGVKTAVDFGPGGIRVYSLELVVDMGNPAESYQAICQAGELAQELLAQARDHFGLGLQEQTQLQGEWIAAQAHRCDVLYRAYAGE